MRIQQRARPWGGAWAGLVMAVLGLAVSQPVQANEGFKFTPKHMQALGVQLQRLGAGQADAVSTALPQPARVVLPPSHEQVLAAPVAGVVERLLVAEHQALKAGTPVLKLLSPEWGELQLRLAEAASRARLSASAVLRDRALLADGVVPPRRLQEAEAAAAEDRARQGHAESALRLAGADEALIRHVADGGPLQDGLWVRARDAGVLSRLEVKPGQRVQASEVLARLVDTRRLWLEVQLPTEASRPPVGATLEVVDREARARVLSVAPMVSDSQTLMVRAEVVSGASGLRAGEALTVRVAGGPAAPAAEAWTLPLSALARHDDRAWVFVRREDGFMAVPVRVLASAGARVTVANQASSPAGTPVLKAGQEVAVASVVALKAAWLGRGGGE